MALAATEFLRRFRPHLLPRGFTRIRHYGLLANRRKREALARAPAALGGQMLPIGNICPTPPAPESVAAFWLRIAGADINRCPCCSMSCSSTPMTMNAS